MKRQLLLLFLLFASTLTFAQTVLEGKVTDPDEDEPLIGATVALYKGGTFVNGTTTDFDGNYRFSNIDPSTYDIEINYTGYPPKKLTGIPVKAGQTNNADVEMSAGVNLTEIVVVGYTVPLIDKDNTTSGQTVTSEEIKNLPTRNINQIASIAAGATSSDEGGDINIRGSRSNGTDYYIDGIRVSGASALIADSEIEQLQVITGGLEARYGDVTGGIISITSKGPSSEFAISAEAETSEGLDNFGQSLVGLGVNGPLLKRADGNTILGYRFYGRYTYQEDDDPSAVPLYRVKDDVLADLQQNPLTVAGGSPFVAADFLTGESVNALKTRPFESSDNLAFNGKLDARLSDAIDISLSGYYSEANDQFTPNENSADNASWRLLNAQNNPTDLNTDYRVNFRFRHRLGGSGIADGVTSKSNFIQNASYTIQLGYENNKYEVADPRHGDNLFNYGHVGNFDIDYVPVLDFVTDPLTGITTGITHVDYREVLRNVDYSSSSNPVLANYNNIYNYTDDQILNDVRVGLPNTAVMLGGNLDPRVRSQFISVNGGTQNVFTESWNFHSNVGSVYNTFFNQDDDRYTFQANASFDIVPGSSDKSRHSIQLGVWYEERVSRSYSVAPRGLWNTARSLVNQHLNTVDSMNRVVGMTDTFSINDGVFFDFTGSVPIYAPSIEANDGTFYKRVRDRLGREIDEFVNIDGLDPNQLSLDLFSAEELTFANQLDYQGYDYLNNEFNGSFDDFFAIDPNTGRRSFNVAPFRPIYAAAYIQDKFTINEIIFRMGVRVDRYDANTKVLKDPYSLYEVIGANDFHANFGGERPGSIGEDFAVYTSTENGTIVQAYRDGDDWYLPDGTQTNGPTEIEGIRTGLVFPKYANPAVHESANFIKEESFTTETSFKDYEVQFNVMPRLAFSFPISDDAGFFAHYDVLVQRPPSNAFASPLDYYYFVERPGTNGRPFNNPALRPERTVDYEVGFQQKLSNTSALKVAAFYRELRDMIQLRTFFPVPLVNQYTTYDNQDFGTVKGFSFTYDLRRTSNVQINANYTLQFADGTGSDANSQQGLTNRGNLRTLFPLNYDERHRVNFVFDYRTGSNTNAPNVLKNLGINLQGTTVSGRPYTAKFQPQPLGAIGTDGAINGSRRPFNFTLNAQVDKDINIGNNASVNLYVRVSNVLDRRNTINVYEATGSPEDPGFLSSFIGRDAVESITNETRPVEGFLASYSWRVLNPDYFSLPRRIFVGARFSL